MSSKELEERLKKAGNKLLDPPSSVDELLPLLEEIESCLSGVEQSPATSMQKALSPSMKALIADPVFRHSDADVKVTVASCISEITRITAPEAPYDDDCMKEVFQLIVSSFKHLSDMSSRSYKKRTAILETVARVRSCVVMLDLECDTLIVEMFQHFLNSIRDYHPEHVFQSMETIMTLVIDESEDVSPELLMPILAVLKKDNEEVLAVAQKLGERVFENCARKLEPYLGQALKFLGTSMDDYSNISTLICQDASVSIKRSSSRTASDHKVDKERASARSTKPALTNGSMQKAEAGSVSDGEPEDTQCSSPLKAASPLSNEKPMKLDSGNAGDKESKSEHTSKRRGRRAGPHSKGEKEAEKQQDDQRSLSNDVPDSANKNCPSEEGSPSESEKETPADPSPEEAGNESISPALPVQSKGQPDDIRPKKGGRPKKKEGATKVVMDPVIEKSPEWMSDAEMKAHISTGRKISAGTSSENKSGLTLKISRKDDVVSGDLEAKTPKTSSKKGHLSTNAEDGSSVKRTEDRKGGSKGKLTEKDIKKSSVDDDDKEVVSSPKSAIKQGRGKKKSYESPKESSKRKRSTGKQASDVKEYGEDLVGSKIKVWWPRDKAFYEGVVDSFDSDKMKHKVVYNDGDEEILNLRREKWEFVEGNSGTNKVPEGDNGSSDASPELPLKKRKKMKEGKMETSAKKGDASSSKKSRSGLATSSSKTKIRSKSAKDGISENGSKSGGVASSKVDKSGKMENKTSRVSKSKDDDSGTPHVSTKSGEESPARAKSKKGTKIGSKGSKIQSSGKPGKLRSSGSGKQKSTSSKVKERKVDYDSADSTKANETKIEKLSSSSKEPESESKTGKKRQRGA